MNLGPLIAGRPFTAHEESLLECLFRCHSDSSQKNQNFSTEVVKAYSRLTENQDPMPGLIAGLMSTGGKHAPILQARRTLFYTSDEAVKAMIRGGVKIPGFGNSFFKDCIDPSWEPLHAMFIDMDIPAWDRVLEVGSWIAAITGNSPSPNAAAFTAVIAEHLRLDMNATLWLFLVPRTAVWLTL